MCNFKIKIKKMKINCSNNKTNEKKINLDKNED